MTRQTVTINLHSPIVHDVERQAGDNRVIVVALSNGEYHGTVNMFLTTEQWYALRDKVNGFLVEEEEHAAAEPTGDLYCDACSFIAPNSTNLGVHVARMHEPYGRKK